jgi:hypothetical protein
MYGFIMKKWKILLIGAVLSALIGCAGGKSYDYQPTAGEMKPGPGALTGESGELTIYDSKQGGLFPKGDDSKAETATATAAAQEGKASTESSTEDKEFQEFQEYQQWKKEKQEFREYQEWKKSAESSPDFMEFQEYQQWKKTAKDSPDFKEFQEWKEWKTYQEWKKSKGRQ